MFQLCSIRKKFPHLYLDQHRLTLVKNNHLPISLVSYTGQYFTMLSGLVERKLDRDTPFYSQ